MARLIVKSPYIKCGAGQSAAGYLKYIATRERVEIIPDDRPPTQKQTQLIAKLVEDFPDAKELMEYEDYAAHPTKASASALITLALESNWDRLSSMEGYAKYIALRPRAERLGEHGLFGDDDNVDLNRVMDELDHYTGNVWTHIISLHREDAERLGYNHAEAWRTLLRTHRNDIAAAMKIPPRDFRWYAAFHDEGNHPHVHMMAWSAKPNQAYLSKDGIRQIKSTLTNQIFRQELLHVYEQKSKSRDELVAEARKAMLELAKAMREMTCIHPEAELDFEKIVTDISPETGLKVSDVEERTARDRSDSPILIAEDSPLLGKMISECLKKSGYTNLIMTMNGQEAWDKLTEFKNKGTVRQDVHCIITDIEMPLMDGHRLTKLCKSDDEIKKIPLIIFSSLVNEEMRRKGEQLGADAQLTKPEIGMLVEAIDNLIDKSVD